MAKTVESQMAGVVGQIDEIQKGVTYSDRPTVRGRRCNMLDDAGDDVPICKNEAEFTAVDNRPGARKDTAKTDAGEPVVHDACENHVGKIWRLGLQVVPINAHVPVQ
jgi:hypothetical protein